MKARQKIFLFLGLLSIGVISFVLFLIPTTATTATTAFDAVITNEAVLSWNGGATTNIVSTNVGTMYGGTWIGGADVTVSAGASVTNTNVLHNLGNASASFNLTSEVVAGGTATGTWTVNFSLGGGDVTSSGSISPGSETTIYFVVDVDATEGNGNFQEYKCTATDPNAVAADARAYTGNNTTNYGGDMGVGTATEGTIILSNTNNTQLDWRITVNAAVMGLTKTVVILNPEPYHTNNGLAVPGALLTYKLAYSNTGSATATGLSIVDKLPTMLEYKDDSLKSGTHAAVYADGGNTDIADAEGNGAGCTNGETPAIITFVPNGGNINYGDATGTCGAGASGSYFYQSTLY